MLRSLGTGVPQWDPGAKPRSGSGDEVSEKLKLICLFWAQDIAKFYYLYHV